MKHATIQGGSLVEYNGRFAIDKRGTQHPLRPMTREEKLAYGIYEIEYQYDVPLGYTQTGRELVLGNGVAINQPVCKRMPIEDYRTDLHARVKSAYSQAMAPIAQAYPPEEREGWAEQVAAAQEVLAGGQNDLIDALRTPTGETAHEMAQKIIGLRQQYIISYGQVTAARRGVAAQIEAATTLAELDAIDVNAAFGLTG